MTIYVVLPAKGPGLHMDGTYAHGTIRLNKCQSVSYLLSVLVLPLTRFSFCSGQHNHHLHRLWYVRVGRPVYIRAFHAVYEWA